MIKSETESNRFVSKVVSKRLVLTAISRRLISSISLDDFLRRYIKTDVVSFADSGDLIKTDYTDMAYFDADYVGTIDSF